MVHSSDIPQELCTLWEEYAKFLEKANANNDFVETESIRADLTSTLELSDITITHGMARQLDQQYVGSCGSWWAGPYGFPEVGDTISVPCSNGTTEDFVVTKVGLLTLDAEKPTA